MSLLKKNIINTAQDMGFIIRDEQFQISFENLGFDDLDFLDLINKLEHNANQIIPEEQLLQSSDMTPEELLFLLQKIEFPAR